MVAPSAAGLAGLPIGREAMIRKILIGLFLVIAIPVVWFATLGRAPEPATLQERAVTSAITYRPVD